MILIKPKRGNQNSPVPIADRLWPRLEWQPNGCWLWTGKVSQGGYGHIGIKRGDRWHSENVHRVAYELINGAIGSGLEIDHLCGNKLCCRPNHLEAVSRIENIRRQPRCNGVYCKRGHILSDKNTYTYRGLKKCKMCHAMATRRYLDKRRNQCF